MKDEFNSTDNSRQVLGNKDFMQVNAQVEPENLPKVDRKNQVSTFKGQTDFDKVTQIYEAKRHDRFELFSLGHFSAAKDLVYRISPFIINRDTVEKVSFHPQTMETTSEDVIEYLPSTFEIVFRSAVGPSIEQIIFNSIKDEPNGPTFILYEYDPCGNPVSKWTITNAKIISAEFGEHNLDSNDIKEVKVTFLPDCFHLEY